VVCFLTASVMLWTFFHYVFILYDVFTTLTLNQVSIEKQKAALYMFWSPFSFIIVIHCLFGITGK
jgi:hypothetical protein